MHSKGHNSCINWNITLNTATQTHTSSVARQCWKSKCWAHQLGNVRSETVCSATVQIGVHAVHHKTHRRDNNLFMQLFILNFLSVSSVWPQAYWRHCPDPCLNAKLLISWCFSWGPNPATVWVLQAICRSQGENLRVPRSFHMYWIFLITEDDTDITLNSFRNTHSQMCH